MYEEWSDSRVVTIYSLEDIQSMRMTRDASDEYTLCVATHYNGEKYWYQIDDSGNCSEVLLLSDHNKNWLNDCYNACVNNIPSPYSMEYCVYQAKNKLDNAINNNQIYDVGQSSDEYYGLWLFFSLLEENYRQAILLEIDIVNLAMAFVDVAEQAYVLAHNISMLVDAVQIHYSVQLMSGLYAARSFGLLTDAQAFNEGITDVVTYTGPRPTWRQSEIYASTTLYTSDCGYLYNQSYKLDANGKFVRAQYGELGSIRPDFYNELTEHCVDIKNYTVTTTSGRNNLVNNVVNQYDNRINILPASTKYEVVVDVRGQSWSQDMLDDILSRITQRTNGKVAVSFVK